MNLQFKNGSTILNRLLDFGLRSSYIGKGVFRSVLLLIRPRGNTITEEDLLLSNSGPKRPDSLQPKRGNLVQETMENIAYYISPMFYWGHIILLWLSSTYYYSKRKPETNSQYGGKITEKANVKGNALDTRGRYVTSTTLGLQSTDCRLQNSVCLVKVSLKQFKREYSSQDLYTLTSMKNQEGDTVRKKVSRLEYQHFDPNKAKEIVEMKQTELVRLAERHGLYDIKVFDRQLLLARSLIFRQYAAWSIIKKAGSQTP